MKKATPLKIPIERIPLEGIDIPVFLKPEWFVRWRDREPGLEFIADSPLSGMIRLEKSGDYLLIRGELAGELILTCSRCLDTFLQPLDCRFDLVLKPAYPPNQYEEVELTAEELEMDYYTGNELDLERIIQEQILLNLPLKPLCREDCRGLCPHCGANLNRESCTCPRVEFHHPFAVLEKLTETSK